jgi:hypothetical protein
MSNEDNGVCTCPLIKENNLNHLHITHFSLLIVGDSRLRRQDKFCVAKFIKKRRTKCDTTITHFSLHITHFKKVFMKKRQLTKKALRITSYIVSSLILIYITFWINALGMARIVELEDRYSYEQVEEFFLGLGIVFATTVGFLFLNKFLAKQLANTGLFISMLVLYFILSVGGCGLLTAILSNFT